MHRSKVLVIMLALLVLGMAGATHAIGRALGQERIGGWIELVLAAPVVLWGGWPFFERAVVSVRVTLMPAAVLIDRWTVSNTRSTGTSTMTLAVSNWMSPLVEVCDICSTRPIARRARNTH